MKDYSFLLVGINAKYIHSNPAIRSLKAYAGKEYKDVVSIREYTINNRREEILSDIYKLRPDAIGFSVYIWNVSLVRELICDLSKLLPTCQIFLGGPEVSYDSEQYLKDYPNVAAIILGEGEITFRRILAARTDSCYIGNDLELIPGLLLRSGYTGPQEAVDMDHLPFLYQSEGMSLLEDYENRIIYYESSRGCPYNCSYCLSSIERGLHFRSLPLVLEELDFFLKNNVKQVKFIDRTFNIDSSRALEIWDFLQRNDNGVTNFHFEIAGDILTAAEIEMLGKFRPGQVQLEIGVQTTNEKAMKAINRPCNIKHLSEVVELIRSKNNIHIHLDLIAGLPYEDFESFKQSFNDVFNMRPHQLQLGFLKVLNGTPIKKQAGEFGICYCNEPPYEVLYTDSISYDEILILKNVEAVTEIYYNSSQFTQSLPYLLDFFDTPFDLFEALGKYYEDNGLFVVTPARSKRYDILLDFSDSFTNCDKEHLRYLLTLDYYMREKPKAKPSFVINPPDKDLICYDIRNPITGNYDILNQNDSDSIDSKGV